MAAGNCQTDLFLPILFDRRKINTPKVTASAPLQRFQDKTRGNPVSNPRLDHVLWPQVTNQTPYRPSEPGVTVIPRPKTFRARSNPFCLQFCNYLGPQAVELRSELARPLGAETRMKPLLPVVVGFV